MRVAALALVLCACSGRRCGGTPVERGIDAGVVPVDRDRCRSELLHAAVATPPGFGPIMDLVPACGDDGTLVVWALRGHTLSRLARGREPGSTFGVPVIVSTGATALGPTAIDAPRGPLAWRSPTLALDEPVGDEWWGASLDAVDGGFVVRRGSTLMPTGTRGEGIVAPVERSASGVVVMGSISRGSDAPILVEHEIRAPSDEVESLSAVPPALADGTLEAYEPQHRRALVVASAADGSTELRALELDPLAAHATPRGEIPLEAQRTLVVARGVAHETASLFAFSEFALSTGDAGDCIQIESLCVRPGPVRVARVDANGVTTVTVAPAGLIDTLGLDGDDRAVVLYVAGHGEMHEERGARVDVVHGTSEALRVVPSDEIPPIDRPSLLRCGREPWLVAEVLIGAPDAGEAPETGVMAVPADCLLAPQTRHDVR